MSSKNKLNNVTCNKNNIVKVKIVKNYLFYNIQVQDLKCCKKLHWILLVLKNVKQHCLNMFMKNACTSVAI